MALNRSPFDRPADVPLDDGDLVRTIADIRRAQSYADIGRLARDALRAVGVRRMSYHHMPPPGAFDASPFVKVVASGFPESWVRHYEEEQLYCIDPIPKKAASSCRPFFWSECAADGTSPADDYLRELKQAGLGDGLAIPVFGPHARNGYVGLGCSAPDCPWSDSEIIFLQYVAQAGHLRYCELLEKKLPEATDLSDREGEILRWIARGKSNAVIADILELSPNTVDTYTRRIFRKLKVVDRVTASLRGYALGFLD